MNIEMSLIDHCGSVVGFFTMVYVLVASCMKPVWRLCFEI